MSHCSNLCFEYSPTLRQAHTSSSTLHGAREVGKTELAWRQGCILPRSFVIMGPFSHSKKKMKNIIYDYIGLKVDKIQN